jgi:hypothetical protein
MQVSFFAPRQKRVATLADSRELINGAWINQRRAQKIEDSRRSKDQISGKMRIGERVEPISVTSWQTPV